MEQRRRIGGVRGVPGRRAGAADPGLASRRLPRGLAAARRWARTRRASRRARWCGSSPRRPGSTVEVDRAAGGRRRRDPRCPDLGVALHTDRIDLRRARSAGGSAAAPRRPAPPTWRRWCHAGRGGRAAADAVHRRAARPAGRRRCRRGGADRAPVGCRRRRRPAAALRARTGWSPTRRGGCCSRMIADGLSGRRTAGTCPAAAPITASSRPPGCSASWSRRPGSSAGCVDLLGGRQPAQSRRARARRGSRSDWHGVRVIYRVRVDAPTEAVVTEAAGGSTARAAWFTPARSAELPLTDVPRRWQPDVRRR